MGRIIKFRAWDEGNKVMHFNFQFIKSGEEGNDWVVFTSDKQRLIDEPSPFENPYLSQQLKVMQFTGLTDKKDKEIYEGDICKIYESDMSSSRYKHCLYNKSVIRFYGSAFVYEQPLFGCGLATLYLGYINSEFIEVVGNIYQDPELLK